MHLNPSDLEQLQPEFDKAFTAMAELEGGAIANPMKSGRWGITGSVSQLAPNESP